MQRTRLGLTTLFCLILCATSGCTNSFRLIHTEQSAYGNVYVVDESNTRCMRFSLHENSNQSCFLVNKPDFLVFDCNKMIMGSLCLHPNPQKILIIGLGGASLPNAFMKLFPESEIQIVELDPAVVKVAEEYFNFRQNSRVHVSVEDGRTFVKRAGARGKKYDLIVLDAFGDSYIPEHMMTQEFLTEVKHILRSDGVLAANTFSTSKTYDRESETYRSVFGRFYNLKKFLYGNRIILVTHDAIPPREILTGNSAAVESKLRLLGIEPSWLLPLFSPEQDWDDRANILRDRSSMMITWD